MSPLRYYFDDDVGQIRVVARLRSVGIDCITSLEAGMFGSADETHLIEATRRGRVICTGNRGDFNRLNSEWLNSGLSHAGMVLIVRNRYSIGELARRLERLAREISAEEMANRIEYLSGWGAPR